VAFCKLLYCLKRRCIHSFVVPFNSKAETTRTKKRKSTAHHAAVR
jgi:hypothetical protein